MPKNVTYKYLAADKRSEIDFANASWIEFPGKGDPIEVHLGKTGNDVKSALNAVSDWYFAGKYNQKESVRGLHLYEGKSLSDDFAGQCGYVHVGYKGDAIKAPSLEDFPLGWAAVSQLNGIRTISAIPDLRTEAQKAEHKKNPKDFEPTDIVASRKHNWLDAVLTGRPIRLQIGYLRPYFEDRINQWEGHTVDEVRQERRGHIVAYNVDRTVTRPAYRAAKGRVEELDNQPLPVSDTDQPAEPVGWQMPTSITFKVKDKDESFDLLACPDIFYPVIYDRKGGLVCTGNYRWDPTKLTKPLVELFAGWASAGCSIRLS